jgi:hypothetical protein
MPDVEDDNDEALLIDLIKNAPIPGEASTVDAEELFAERSAHALRIREQWPCDQSMAATATLCGSSSASARPDSVHVVVASDYASAGCGGGCGIRTREGVKPTRFPSRPAGVPDVPSAASSGQERDCELGPPGSRHERPRTNERTPDRTC